MAEVFVRGYDPKDSSVKPAKQDTKRFKAGAAISAGSVVVADVSDASGETVIASTLALAAYGIAVGVYDGQGGSGAVSTVTGMPGKDAVTGDLINVVKQGVVVARAYAVTTANYSTAGIMRLTPGTTSGCYTEATIASQNEAVLWAATTIVTTGAIVAVTARVAYR